MLSIAVIGVGIAWACTPQAYLSGVNPSSGPSGTSVSLSGAGFHPPEEGVVEIRWDSAAGPVLGTTNAGPAPEGVMNAVVSVPTASPGTYTIVAVARRNDGSQAGVGSQTFTVTAPAAAPATGSTGGGEGSAGGRTAATVTGGTGGAGSAGGGSGAGGGSSGGGGVAAIPAEVTSVGGTPVFAGSLPAGGERSALPASERSALAELWGGFRSDAGVIGGGTSVAVDGASGPQLTIGIALLAIGLIALTGSFAVAAARRRRAEA